MNKTTGIILGALAILLIIGGIVYSNKNPSVDEAGNPIPSSVTNNTYNTSTTNSTSNPSTSTSLQPAAPVVNTNATAYPTDTTVIINGTVNPRGAFTTYWFEYGVTSNFGGKTSNQNLGSGFTQISAPGYISNLNKNTTYYYRLVAENQYGKVQGATYNFKTTEGTPPPVGSLPTVKTTAATSITRTSSNINGEVTANKALTEYWFEYGKTTDLGNTSAFASAGEGTGRTTASVSLSDLSPATTYYFRINAHNKFGTVNGSIMNFKTLGPAQAQMPFITTGNATAVTSSSATLRGTVNPNLSDTEYWFEYSTDSLLGQLLLKSTDPVSAGSGSTAVSISQSITGLEPNTTYYYHIVARNSMGTVKDGVESFKTK